MLTAVIIVAVQFGLAAYFIASVWRADDRSVRNWWLKVGYSGGYVAYIFLVGRWDWVGYLLRYVMASAFLAAAIVGRRRLAVREHTLTGPGAWASEAVAVLTMVVMLGLTLAAARGYVYEGEAVRLESPLRGGVYYVGQGGDSRLVNYHNTHPEQRYALDVVALNGWGTRAWGVYPSSLKRYVIFGAVVYSPCRGTVVSAVDGLADLIPPEADPSQPAGNHVVIACNGVQVTLAHLQNGSVTVSPGSTVSVGEPVGRVGNSGNTSEPHLHVHAVRVLEDGSVGDGVPVLVDGVFAVRNTTIRR